MSSSFRSWTEPLFKTELADAHEVISRSFISRHMVQGDRACACTGSEKFEIIEVIALLVVEAFASPVRAQRRNPLRRRRCASWERKEKEDESGEEGKRDGGRMRALCF